MIALTAAVVWLGAAVAWTGWVLSHPADLDAPVPYLPVSTWYDEVGEALMIVHEPAQLRAVKW